MRRAYARRSRPSGQAARGRETNERRADVRTIRRDSRGPDDAGSDERIPVDDRRAPRPLPGPYKVWVHNPKLLQAAAPLGEHFTPGQSSLSEREREIAVVVITNRWHSAYPPAAHERRGKEVGLPAATVEAIMAGLPTSFSDAREQVVYEVATTLAGGRLVSQGLYDRAVKALGHEGVRSEEHTSELQSQSNLVCRLLLEKK